LGAANLYREWSAIDHPGGRGRIGALANLGAKRSVIASANGSRLAEPRRW